MANLFLNLPLPVGNGPGASVDTSAMGGPRTITALGSFPGSTLTIEISNDGGLSFVPLTLFQNVGGDRVIPIAAQWMRVNVSGRKGAVPFAANVDVGAPATGGQFALLPLPVGNGTGAAVNIAAFGPFMTAIVTGTFAGCSVIVEISEDGIDWAPSVLFASYGGHASRVATANFARARVSGRSSGVPFTTIVTLGAIDLGGSVGGQLVIEDEGVPVPGAPHSVLNFIGNGVAATDGGGGVADVTIPGTTYVDQGVPVPGAPHHTINFLGLGVSAFDAGGGVLEVEIPGGPLPILLDEGVPVPGAPHTIYDFVGAGVTVTDLGGGSVQIAVPGAGGGESGTPLFWGADSIGAAADTRFVPPGREFSVAPAVDMMRIPINRSGTLRLLGVRHNSADGNGQDVVYELLVGGVATGVTVTLATGAIGQAVDLVNTFAVVAPTFISLRAVKAVAVGGGNINVQASAYIDP